MPLLKAIVEDFPPNDGEVLILRELTSGIEAWYTFQIGSALSLDSKPSPLSYVPIPRDVLTPSTPRRLRIIAQASS
jgi:hypothetical protein